MKIFILLITILSLKAYAWGPTGHRVVGHIAEMNLDKRVKKKVLKLLDGESLSRVSNWPDKIKSDRKKYSHTFPWHYTDWPTNQKSYSPKNNSGSLVASIKKHLKAIKSKSTYKDQKAFAIKFLIHLIGDLHTPLHIGNGKDRGGNDCEVMFHNSKTNLHALWDYDMINFTKLSYTELSEYVIDAAKITKPNVSGDIIDWALESKKIRLTIYPKPLEKEKLNIHQNRKYCLHKDLLDKQLPNLSYGYSYKNLPIVEQRLYQAGVRLANLLNISLKN